MRFVRRAVVEQAQETRVFLLMAAFGLGVALLYWLITYETVGTLLLGGFGLATGVIALRLAVDRRSRRLRSANRPVSARADLTDGPSSPDVAVGGTAGVDRPFADESGRLPAPTIAPFAVGAGVALAATGLVFGLAPIVVGLLPLGWGAWTWLSSAGDELAATAADDAIAEEPAEAAG
ncbi:MAG: hypothetical protein ACJ765_01170 [Chloroflexota bacterium]